MTDGKEENLKDQALNVVRFTVELMAVLYQVLIVLMIPAVVTTMDRLYGWNLPPQSLLTFYATGICWLAIGVRRAKW